MIPRYSRPQMTKIWDTKNKFRIWYDIEALACEALAEIGTIPKSRHAISGPLKIISTAARLMWRPLTPLRRKPSMMSSPF